MTPVPVLAKLMPPDPAPVPSPVPPIVKIGPELVGVPSVPVFVTLVVLPELLMRTG